MSLKWERVLVGAGFLFCGIILIMLSNVTIPRPCEVRNKQIVGYSDSGIKIKVYDKKSGDPIETYVSTEKLNSIELGGTVVVDRYLSALRDRELVKADAPFDTGFILGLIACVFGLIFFLVHLITDYDY